MYFLENDSGKNKFQNHFTKFLYISDNLERFQKRTTLLSSKSCRFVKRFIDLLIY